ncbi:MAG: hypothetical protein ACM3ZC_00765 [Bacteroidota bacterium]
MIGLGGNGLRRVPIVIMLLLASCVAGAQGSAENEAMNRAFEYCAAGDFQNAAAVLEEILPRTQNEELYWKLAEVYDSNLHDYGKASAVYRKYLDRFPEGRFAADFQRRLEYLTAHRGEWDVLARYKAILDTYHARPRADSIEMMRRLLADHPRSSLTVEIQSWLAWEYYQDKQTGLALQYINEVMAHPPASGEANKLTDVCQTYSMLLAETRHYGKAIRVLEESGRYGLDPAVFAGTIATLKKERRLWIGFVVSLACVILAIAAIVFLRPWQEKGFKTGWLTVLSGTALIVISALIAMWIVQWRQYGTYKVFLALGAGGGPNLVLAKLLAPMARRINRKAYLAAVVILTVACIYILYYIYDTLSVFYQLPDFNS